MENSTERPKSQETQDAVIARLKGVISEKMTLAMSTKSYDVLEKIADFAAKVRKDHPDYQSYVLYHVLAQSSIKEGADRSNFDFLGEDSIQAFIENL